MSKSVIELEDYLNKEYSPNAVIKISSMRIGKVPISEIYFIKEIMDSVEPLHIEERIVVGKRKLFKAELIDGYHRLKSKIYKGDDYIEAYVLTDYDISRTEDTLYQFIEKCKGRYIKFTNNQNIIVDGDRYFIEPNSGCGGCSNGWSELSVVDSFLNKKILVSEVSSNKHEECEDCYDLIINNKIVAVVDTGYGNGYYGGDFEIVKIGEQ